MVNTEGLLVRGGSVVGGMVASNILADQIVRMIPRRARIRNMDDIVQVGMGVGSIVLLGGAPGMIRTVGVYGGIGSVASGILGLLGMRLGPLASAGEEMAFAGEDEELLEASAGELIVDEETGEVYRAAAGEVPEWEVDDPFVAATGEEEFALGEDVALL